MLSQINFWYWLIFSLALIAMESLGFGGFLIGASLASFLVFILTWIKPSIDWTYQVMCFSFFALIFTFLYWKIFKKFNEKSENELLNSRAARCIGRKFVLIEDIVGTNERVQLGDTLWKVSVDAPLKKGTLVIVVSVKEMVLFIKPLI